MEAPVDNEPAEVSSPASGEKPSHSSESSVESEGEEEEAEVCQQLIDGSFKSAPIVKQARQRLITKSGRSNKKKHRDISRNGCPTKEDFDAMNSRIVVEGEEWKLPSDIQHAVPTNKERCAINDGIFAKHLEETHSKSRNDPIPDHTVVIKADKMKWPSGKNVGPRTMHEMFSKCSDCDVKTEGERGHFVDPFVKLHIGCPMMLVENANVAEGEANGTLCKLERVVLNKDVAEEDTEIITVDGHFVRMVSASQVNHLVCKFDCGPSFQGSFTITQIGRASCRERVFITV